MPHSATEALNTPSLAVHETAGDIGNRKAATYQPISVLSAADLHLANRFTGGWTPTLSREFAAAGGARKWFEKQMTAATPDTFFTQSSAWWRSNTASTALIVDRNRKNIEETWMAVANYERWCLARRIHSERQVLETMAAFWENHLHVPSEADAAQVFRASYGRTIRTLALTSFERLLTAAITHPAMGCFLDNAKSTKSAPNENLGRELLELHTVGRDAKFTENDVKNSAKILTGYRVDTWDSWKVWYDKDSHFTGRVKVLGFRHANAAADGRAVATAYLSYLARHPSTARRIARKLAVRFVSDTPSSALITHLADVYTKNHTQIVPVLRALIATNEFKKSVGAKVRTPDEDAVASYRAIGARLAWPKIDDAAANQILWQTTSMGMRPFGWPRPDGRPDEATAWTSVSRMLASFSVHQDLTGTWWPTNGVTYVEPAAWLPAPSVSLGDFIDHLSRRILGRPATPVLLTAACEAVGLARTTVITADHAVIQWQMPRLLTVFLDTPTHMTR